MRFVLFIMFLVLFGGQAHALKGSVCATGGDSIGFVSTDVAFVEYTSAFVRPGLCGKIEPARTGLRVVKIGLGVATIASLCGIGTAPVSLGLGIATATVEVIDATTSLVCDTGEPTKEELTVFLCQQLRAQGLSCDPNVQLQEKP